jgi:hypothetical protein
MWGEVSVPIAFVTLNRGCLFFSFDPRHENLCYEIRDGHISIRANFIVGADGLFPRLDFLRLSDGEFLNLPTGF